MTDWNEAPGEESLYVVRVRVDPGVEDQWNAWYDNEHLPEILACPGFASGRRFVTQDAAGDRSYLTVYSISDSTALDTPEFAAAKGWYHFLDAVEYTTETYHPVSKEG